MNKQINIRELLDWYIMAGVVETCGDLPVILNANNVNPVSEPVESNKNQQTFRPIKPDNFVS